MFKENSSESLAQKKNLHIFIYYVNAKTDEDKSFERAAKWAAKQLKTSPNEIKKLMSVAKKQDFINTWNKLKATYQHTTIQIFNITIFCHASKAIFRDNKKDGLEFPDGTLLRSDIAKLARLPWSAKGSLYLSACNSGLMGKRNWCPAQEFSKHQSIQVYGEPGAADFSKKLTYYVESSPKDTEIYLHAYKRGWNGLLGDGRRMAPNQFVKGKNLSTANTLARVSIFSHTPQEIKLATSEQKIKTLLTQGDAHMALEQVQEALDYYKAAREELSATGLNPQLQKDTEEVIQEIESVLNLIEPTNNQYASKL